MNFLISTQRNLLFIFLLVFTFIFLAADQLSAIPAFARKYNTSCSTCHYAYPKLNAFGKAFKNNGYRYPAGQDAEMTKEEPVSLGSEGYKKVWPDAIWPSDIPGTVPVSMHAIGRVFAAGGFDDPTTTATEEDKIVSFEIPHELELLFGGTIGENLSFFGELEWEHIEEFAYEFALQYDFSPGFHLKLGSVGPQATPEHHKLTAEHYNVVDLKTQSGKFRLRNGAGGGIEFWGAGNGIGGSGGFTYAIGIGNGQNDADNFDINKEKDIFGRVTYKFGGLGEIGGTEGQTNNTSAFYEDNSFRIGGFFQKGTALATNLNDEFSVFGGDIDIWYNRLNVVALVMNMSSDYKGYDRKSLAYFVEANYVLYPWVIALARYEFTDIDTDIANPTVSSLIPGVVFMVRANVKASLEFKIPLDDASKNANKEKITLQFNFSI
ncbi:MAG: hypothetical protein CO128_07115 [Ignavibacteriales bacterium CG_4_9_14_3_um_filter_30_11]|nr:MAG: hypothetical protein CO128_07115 [Ignavibacteriales bacterium CG_4_9_14_3_um_filter_30_11]